MKRWISILLLILSSSAFADEVPTPSPSPTPDPAIAALIEKAENLLYAFDERDHLDRLEQALNELEKFDPALPYLYWARARLTFWRKEEFYLREKGGSEMEYEKPKLELAEACHKDADRCIALSPRTPECHLMKGACYAMQASTWGATFKTVRVLKPMDLAWEKAMKLPSNFTHRDGATTKQLAQILRAILFRVMPENFWFRLLAGIRGNKEKAYNWIKEAVVPPLRKDPLIMIELAAAALCSGKEDKVPSRIQEGLETLQEAMAIKPRNGADERDLKNMKYLFDHPEEACDYRRERFEKVTKDKIES